jgi:molybdate transport system substrate-binding protein
MKRIFATTTAALSAAAIIAGCGHPNSNTASTTGSPPGSVTGPITVFAAASLKSTFTALGAEFEKNNPGTHVTFSFAGSSDLVAQLTGGAPADVFASADITNMTKAVNGGLIWSNPVNFASNTLTIVTPPGNPRNIHSFADLAKPGTQVVVCAPPVPCGAATKKLESATGVTLNPVSEESNVTDVLGKVVTGQADAGLVYVTDAAGAGTSVSTVSFPESGGAVNTYPIAVLKESKNSAAAQRFVDLVVGPDGRKTLAAAGFAGP